MLPAACGDPDRTDGARWVEALSSTATLALAGVVLTGALNVWRGAGGSVGQLAGTPYGTVLWVKLGLVGVAATLGGANRFFVMPRLLGALRGPPFAVEPPLRRFVRIRASRAPCCWQCSPPPGNA